MRTDAPSASPGGPADLLAICAASAEEALRRLSASADGLTAGEAEARLKTYGPNRARRERPTPILLDLWRRIRNPLNILLLTLAAISWFLSDLRSALVIAIMVALSVGLGFVQEHRSGTAAAKLALMVQVQAAVRRRDTPDPDAEGFVEAPLEMLVPGDIVRLAAGDLVPADVRLLSAKDLYVNQSALTGESLPVAKDAGTAAGDGDGDALSCPNLCFMGSSVASGYATALVLRTGLATDFGRLAAEVAAGDVKTAFQTGLDRFVWLMLRFMFVMVPAVFLINGFTKHDWLEALFFAVAVAVGLTPEMLPMIVTVNLARGAIALSRRRVIVKRLGAIQDFGAMDILCADKTGTLTQDRVIVKLHIDVEGRDDDRVLTYAWLNSRHQSGLRNLLDEAILEHVELETHPIAGGDYRKLDEMPFDFTRRRLSVVVQRGEEPPLLICKGAVEEILQVCSRYQRGGEIGALDPSHLPGIQKVTRKLNHNGFRVIAVAIRQIAKPNDSYSVADENDLTLIGFIGFLDPPKETARAALAALETSGVAIKILTGDNDLVTRRICHAVGLPVRRLLLGQEMDAMSDAELAAAAEQAQVFAKVSPDQKARVIAALRSRGHVVGFLGDGINDGPALKAADVGISVDTAVDVAKESAGIILLEKSLGVLNDGVYEGRRVFGNILKYIRMGASSNFGNVLSVLGGSILLPFLPMAPLQVLTNNLLYDVSQTAIPTDAVDPELLGRPRKWEISGISRFMLFMGPVSSLFDYATFAVMLYVFQAGGRASLFQTGWFVESLLTQTLVIHVIRTVRIPFLQSRASAPLIATTLLVCAAGAALPYSPLAAALGFTPLPGGYWPIVAGLLVAYAGLAHLVKTWLFHRWGV